MDFVMIIAQLVLFLAGFLIIRAAYFWTINGKPAIAANYCAATLVTLSGFTLMIVIRRATTDSLDRTSPISILFLLTPIGLAIVWLLIARLDARDQDKKREESHSQSQD